MNIEQAKQIPIRVLVEYLGGRYSHNGRAGEVWFFSPFRPEEKTASFKIDEKKNTWHDFGHVSGSSPGQGSGGDTINLWCDYHNQDRKTIREALKGLAAFSGGRVAANPKQPTHGANSGQISSIKSQDAPDRFKMYKKPSRIYFDSLKAELDRRGISQAAALPFLKQAYIEDTKTGKQYNGFAFPNDKGGFEISIPNPARQTNFKTVIGNKAPSIIQAASSTTYLIFEGFFDFLTWQEMNKGQGVEQHIIVLNSLSFISQAAQLITGRKAFVLNVIEFLDNDNAGELARTKFYDLMGEAEINTLSANNIYQGYDDLNDWWVKCPTARTDWQRRQNEKKAANKVYNDTAWNQVSPKPKPKI